MVNNFLKFNLRYFFANKFTFYLYVYASLLLLLVYGSYIFIFHIKYDYIPTPFHVFTYNIDKYYILVYWVLIPFFTLCMLASRLANTSIQIQMRLNSFWKFLSFHFIQVIMLAIWSTFLICIITISCFLVASKAIMMDDVIQIGLLLFFSLMNFVNLGLLLLILAKMFSELISFIVVILIALCDQYIFEQFIFKTTKLLYRPNHTLLEVILSLGVNGFIMLILLLLLFIQLQRKGN